MAYRLLFVPLVKEAFYKAFPLEEPLKFGSTLPAYLGSAVLGALPAESAKAVGSIVNGYSDSLRALVTASVQTAVVGRVELEVKVVEGPDGLVRASEVIRGESNEGGALLEVFVGKGAEVKVPNGPTPAGGPVGVGFVDGVQVLLVEGGEGEQPAGVLVPASAVTTVELKGAVGL